MVPQGLSGPDLAEHVSGLFAAFPDLSFEIVSAAAAGPERVVARWLMRGTNSGPFRGNPATNRSVARPGVDFIVVESDKIRS